MSSETDRTPAILAESLGKRYRYGGGTEGRLADLFEAMLGRMRGRAVERETFWALRDVSLQVRPGEVVAIIGRNGAGKSTLLKLLARITYPTEGRIEMRGRVASLLEVGAGFDPELSGRENVYLSGAILGMRRQEIAAKFDEIIDFSGIERFLDTPVKRYSSGMFVRLAFAVGAHLESDILLIDEVLSVGDAEFQRKCLAKIHDISREGRALVFVSHNMSAVKRLCDRAYLIRSGRIAAEGRTDDVVAAHLREASPEVHGGVAVVPDGAQRGGSGEAILKKATLLDSTGGPTNSLSLAEPFSVVLEYAVREPVRSSIVELGIVGSDGHPIATVMNTDDGRSSAALPRGRCIVRVDLKLGMLPGTFALTAVLHHEGGPAIDWIEGILTFRVSESSKDGTDTFPWAQVRGSVRPSSAWVITSADDEEEPLIPVRATTAKEQGRGS
jgi:lipopolysaccharide transport system ATP-binding protein